ncbi:NAD(P)H-binding protein [Pseudobacter ginsenosidimutans]|uniref:NAD(P)H dehydrogenase (Quinone) n=1 Tax=Pseudobacter ginsenosidimutans TaxID=661488 RepID=A0A4Q7N390_9BACT|nr:NAD(P)H-binding protein [Pseudobacter ginsenosidimutans]QEC43372.1 NAD-dependent epimerase/dehydratase family protein [Pseudobacter ginsenosidimutans]RZS74738.1 NAD(P)H dehydrogenase (quinone) [Pseudobacter ginsenosidimutans]
MIAITGANGQLGRATIDYLLDKISPSQLVAVVRNPSSVQGLWNNQVQVRQAAYEEPGKLEAAFNGVHTLLQISTTSTGDAGVRQELNVVEAAKRAGVQHICYTSSLQADATADFTCSRQAAATEAAIRASGMQYTFLRNGLYMELILQLAGEVFEGGDICYPAKYARVSFVSRNDIAEALSKLVTGGSDKNRIYEITGSRAWSFYDVCEMLRQEKRLCCRYISISEEEYRAVLQSLPIDADLAELLCSMASGISAGEFSHTGDDLEKILGRPPMQLRSFIKGLQYEFHPAIG